jgi:hypothetical protein
MRSLFAHCLFSVLTVGLLLAGCRAITRPATLSTSPTAATERVYVDPTGQFALALPEGFQPADTVATAGTIFPTTTFSNAASGTTIQVVLMPFMDAETLVLMAMSQAALLAPSREWISPILGMLTNNMPAAGSIIAMRTKQGDIIRMDGFETATGRALSLAIAPRNETYVWIAVTSPSGQHDFSKTATLLDALLAEFALPASAR